MRHLMLFKSLSLTIACTLLALTVYASPAAAKIYKWVDDDGVTQYTEYPPDNAESTEIAPAKQPASDPEAELQKLRERVEALDEQKAEEQAAAQETAEQTQARKATEDDCDRLRHNLVILVSHPGRTNERRADGSVARLTEAERQAKIAQYQQQLDEYCN